MAAERIAQRGQHLFCKRFRLSRTESCEQGSGQRRDRHIFLNGLILFAGIGGMALALFSLAKIAFGGAA